MLVVDASLIVVWSTGAGDLDELAPGKRCAPPLMWSEARSALHERAWRNELAGDHALHACTRLDEVGVEPKTHPRLAREAWRIADGASVGRKPTTLSTWRSRHCSVADWSPSTGAYGVAPTGSASSSGRPSCDASPAQAAAHMWERSHAQDPQAADPLDRAEVIVLSDDRDLVRECGRGYPEIVHVQPTFRLGKMNPQQRP